MKYRNNGYFLGIHGNNASLATKKCMITVFMSHPVGTI